jgi:hypothetical protein
LCRRSGLEKKRRCGWLGFEEQRGARPVWARADVATETCPKSYITAESTGWVEEFLVRRRLGGINFEELTARQVEAFVILEKALAREMKNGGHIGRNAA